MRQPTDRERLLKFMVLLGARSTAPGRVYFTGGATAVLLGWREATIDIDVAFEAGAEALLREIPRLKEELAINVELASPDHFIPALPGWRERSRFVRHEGAVDFFHYDFYAQALAKIERGHALDQTDVREMLTRRLIDPVRALELFARIEPELYRYPAIDPPTFRRKVEEALTGSRGSGSP
jgi:hypothetical protein